VDQPHQDSVGKDRAWEHLSIPDQD